jgi:hypothetical protein
MTGLPVEGQHEHTTVTVPVPGGGLPDRTGEYYDEDDRARGDWRREGHQSISTRSHEEPTMPHDGAVDRHAWTGR